MESINPATGERLKTFAPWNTAQLDQALALAARATPGWQATAFSERARLLRAAAEELRKKGYRARRLEEGFPEWKAERLPVEKEDN